MEEQGKNKKVAFYTLGCKLNFSETSTISREFIKRGYTKVDFHSKADIYVINTCSVTELADKKSRNAIRRAIKTSPSAKIIVIGCYAQLNPNDISKIKGIDLILGNEEKYNLFHYLDSIDNSNKPQIFKKPIEKLEQFYPSYSANDRTRAFLKVQDGCDYHCSYCTIPLARGKSRNPDISDIIRQANEIGNSGIKEIVITGVNIGDFGKSTGETFYNLLKQLEKVKNIERYRISSIEPNLLTDEIIDFIKTSKKITPHFHIPLQSGCDEILQLMQRRYNTSLFVEKIKKIKDAIPSACIGVDIIVGFPGETDELYIATKKLLENINISYLHVFTYSERKNTKAAAMKNKVPHPIKTLRSKELIELSENKKTAFYRNNLNNRVFVLFESQKHHGKMFGFTENYIKIEADYNPLNIDKIVQGRLIGINNNNNGIIELYK